LVGELGITPRLLPSNDAARRRFIFRRGRLREVPASPNQFPGTSLLSLRGKLRLALEPAVPGRPAEDESIFEFAARRIGHEAAAVFVVAMVSGVFAGDPSALSLRACFPKMWELERDHGSLFRAMLATRRSRGKADAAGAPAGRLTSFRGGMIELVDAVKRRLGGAVRTSAPVLHLQKASRPSVGGPGPVDARYIVATTDGRPIEADAVVLAGPASETAAILRALDPGAAALLEEIPTAPLAVVCLGYDADAVTCQRRLDGFGFLVPRGEAVRILGALWETSIYAGRAPEGKVLLRVMIGGARDREAVGLDDESLIRIVRSDLAVAMGLTAPPELVHIVRHARGIPQYVQGHLARMQQLDRWLQRHRGLYLAGSSYRGVSINACIAAAGPLAREITANLQVDSAEAVAG
jgi:oxygen-dependent protoporphyrinogen oxidase